MSSLKATVVPTDDPHGLDHELGRRLGARRSERGLSLRELSVCTGLSAASFSQIERTLSSPSLRSLRLICSALEISMGELFSRAGPSEEDEADIVVRRGARRRIEIGEMGMTKERLTPDSYREMQTMLIRLRAGEDSGERPMQSLLGDRSGLVLSGTLGLEVDGRSFRLEAGGSFGCRVRHGIRFWCAGEEDCEVFWTAAPSIY